MSSLSLMVLICVLWVVGGQIKGRIRDVPVPIIIALYFAFSVKWWMFLALGVTYQIIRLGYGNWDDQDPVKSHLAQFWAMLGIKDREGCLIRGTWGFLVSVIGPLPLVMYLNAWWIYILYIVINTFVNYGVSKFRFGVTLADICVSLALGCILLTF